MIPGFFQYFFIDHQVKQSISARVLIHRNIPIITINTVILAFSIATRRMTKVCVFGCHATTSKANPGNIKNIIPGSNLIDCFILPFQKF